MEPEQIEFPAELRQHSISEQELALLKSDGERALAKDWNVTKRQMEWLIREHVALKRTVAVHRQSVELVQRLVWLATVITGVSGVVALVWKLTGGK